MRLTKYVMHLKYGSMQPVNCTAFHTEPYPLLFVLSICLLAFLRIVHMAHYSALTP